METGEYETNSFLIVCIHQALLLDTVLTAASCRATSRPSPTEFTNPPRSCRRASTWMLLKSKGLCELKAISSHTMPINDQYGCSRC